MFDYLAQDRRIAKIAAGAAGFYGVVKAFGPRDALCVAIGGQGVIGDRVVRFHRAVLACPAQRRKAKMHY